MSQSIDLNPEHHKTVTDILYENIPGRKVLVFGSRAKWTAKNSSDLDLCVTGEKLDSRKLALLTEAFDESPLPFKVDIVEWEAVEDRFREIIRKDGVPLEWPRVSLGFIADINSETISKNNEPQNIRYIDISSVGIGQLTESPKHMMFKDAPSRARRLIKRNDIVISTVRPNRKSRFYVTKELEDAVISTGFAVIRPKPSFIDPIYLYALICSEDFVNYLVRNEKGAAYPAVTQDIIAAYTFTLPPVGVQKLASGVVDPINRKIELNQRMNETLEAMARALFKSWFVDFDPVRAKAEGRKPEGMDADTATLFPAAFNEEGLPEGWLFKKLSEVTSELRRGISPKYIDCGGIRVINQKCIRGGVVSFAPSRRHDHISKSVEGREIISGDVLVNSTGVGTLGRVAQIWSLKEPTIVDSHVTVVRAEKNKITPIYLGQNLLLRQSEIEGLGEGSTGQTELSRARLGDLSLIVPPLILLNKYESVFRPLIDKISFNQDENICLSNIRDTLLPKLISGELRIQDAQARVREAV